VLLSALCEVPFKHPELGFHFLESNIYGLELTSVEFEWLEAVQLPLLYQTPFLGQFLVKQLGVCFNLIVEYVLIVSEDEDLHLSDSSDLISLVALVVVYPSFLA
jgi:hypothetical protein